MSNHQFSESFSDIAVLIVGYRRHKNIEWILQACLEAGIRDFFVILDGVKTKSLIELQDNKNIRHAVSSFEEKNKIEVKKMYLRLNHGCAFTVITGIDWAFHEAKNLIILEDDCLPSPVFFSFISENLAKCQQDPNAWLICGTQFAPKEITALSPIYSKFALTWGWATTSQKWNEIRRYFYSQSSHSIFPLLISLKSDKCFWRAGARRAYLGYTDVWDTILVAQMLEKGKFSILPPTNLVLNVGNDEVSTHTGKENTWAGIRVREDFQLQVGEPEEGRVVDDWLSNYFYQIRLRHIFTTKITIFLDLVMSAKRRKFADSLKTRLTAKYEFESS